MLQSFIRPLKPPIFCPKIVKNRYRGHGPASFVLVLGLFSQCFAGSETQSGKIVFHSDRDGNSEIYSIDADGKHETRLSNNTEYDGFPSWAPDGNSIVFQSARNDHDAIYIMNADGSSPRLVPNTGNGRYPKWSADGQYIAFFSDRNGNTDIYLIDSDGGNLSNLSGHAATDETPSWSADGSTLAFQSDRNDIRPGDRSVDEWNYNFGLFTMSVNGEGVREITGVESNDENPSLSPDGSRIVYQSYINDGLAIVVVNVKTGEKKVLTSPELVSGSPAWSSDGSKIVFDSMRDGNFDIFTMNADGSGLQQVTFTDGFENSGAAMYVTNGQ